MKFNERLIELRKKEGLSQEELGYKLNVTRQTVSKWELGQTTPEMEKLIEIAKVFNVSVDELINEKQEEKKEELKEAKVENNKEETTIPNKSENDNNKKTDREQIVKIGLIVVLIIVIIGIFYSINEKRKEKAAKELMDSTVDEFNQTKKDTFDTFGDIAESMYDKYEDEKEKSNKKNQEIYEKSREKYEKIAAEEEKELEKSHNKAILEMYQGEESGFHVKNLCEEINRINKKQANKIDLKYGDVVTNDERTIISIKQKFPNEKKYEVIIDYNQEENISMVEIQDI